MSDLDIETKLFVQKILEGHIENKEITECETCDEYFEYIPRKRYCDNCAEERKKSYWKKYHQKHQNKILMNKKKHYYENQEAQIERKRKYREENRDKIKESNRKHYLKRRGKKE